MNINHEIHDMFQNEFKDIILSYEEGCYHWIDYEIFDILPPEIQKSYLKGFDPPAIIFNSQNNQITLRCKNKFKKLYYNDKDCSMFYTNSINKYFNYFMEMQDFPE